MQKLFIALIAIIGLIILARPSKPIDPSAKNVAHAQSAPIDPAHGANLVKIAWWKDGFGTVMMITATIKNTGTVMLKDFAIRCQMLGNSGTALGSANTTIYDSLRPGQTRTFRNVNMGFVNSQANSTRCELKSAER